MQGHVVKVHGVRFKVRKINPIDFASGARAIQMHFDTYKTSLEREQLQSLEKHGDKIKEHYRDVIMACVMEPKLSRKEGEPGTIWVENLFTEWEMVTDLYVAIMEVTHGKKKLKSLTSHKTASSK